MVPCGTMFVETYLSELIIRSGLERNRECLLQFLTSQQVTEFIFVSLEGFSSEKIPFCSRGMSVYQTGVLKVTSSDDL